MHVCLLILQKRNSIRINQKQMGMITYGQWVGMKWRNRNANEVSQRISFNMLGIISYRASQWTELENLLQNCEFILIPLIEIKHHPSSLYLILPFPQWEIYSPKTWLNLFIYTFTVYDKEFQNYYTNTTFKYKLMK